MRWKQVFRTVLKEGYRTRDVMSEGWHEVGTVQMGDLIAEGFSKWENKRRKRNEYEK